MSNCTPESEPKKRPMTPEMISALEDLIRLSAELPEEYHNLPDELPDEEEVEAPAVLMNTLPPEQEEEMMHPEVQTMRVTVTLSNGMDISVTPEQALQLQKDGLLEEDEEEYDLQGEWVSHETPDLETQEMIDRDLAQICKEALEKRKKQAGR